MTHLLSFILSVSTACIVIILTIYQKLYGDEFCNKLISELKKDEFTYEHYLRFLIKNNSPNTFLFRKKAYDDLKLKFNSKNNLISKDCDYIKNYKLYNPSKTPIPNRALASIDASEYSEFLSESELNAFVECDSKSGTTLLNSNCTCFIGLIQLKKQYYEFLQRKKKYDLEKAKYDELKLVWDKKYDKQKNDYATADQGNTSWRTLGSGYKSCSEKNNGADYKDNGTDSNGYAQWTKCVYSDAKVESLMKTWSINNPPPKEPPALADYNQTNTLQCCYNTISNVNNASNNK